MNEKRKSLGRGLEALLGNAPESQQKNKNQGMQILGIEEIGPGPFQPRKSIKEEQLKELSQSIQAQGVIQPIVVRERAVQDSITGIKYEIIAGERRWRASQLAGLESIPVVIKTMTDADAVAIALIENIQRENLNPLEEANAFQRLIIEYEMTHQEVANAVGRARASISNILRLLELTSTVQDLVNESKISMGHARALLAIKDRSMQLEVANLIVEKNLSVREAEGLVRGILEGKERKKTTKPKDNDIISLEKELSEKLGAKVAILHANSGKGRLTISYSSVDELEGILERIK